MRSIDNIFKQYFEEAFELVGAPLRRNYIFVVVDKFEYEPFVGKKINPHIVKSGDCYEYHYFSEQWGERHLPRYFDTIENLLEYIIDISASRDLMAHFIKKASLKDGYDFFETLDIVKPAVRKHILDSLQKYYASDVAIRLKDALT